MFSSFSAAGSSGCPYHSRAVCIDHNIRSRSHHKTSKWYKLQKLTWGSWIWLLGFWRSSPAHRELQFATQWHKWRLELTQVQILVSQVITVGVIMSLYTSHWWRKCNQKKSPWFPGGLPRWLDPIIVFLQLLSEKVSSVDCAHIKWRCS